MTELTWEEPPVPARGGGTSTKWDGIAAKLRERPGQWAVVATDATPTTAQNIKKGIYKSMQRGEFEAKASGVKNARAAKIYARYIGEGNTND